MRAARAAEAALGGVPRHAVARYGRAMNGYSLAR
jgi:hypothetical protein